MPSVLRHPQLSMNTTPQPSLTTNTSNAVRYTSRIWSANVAASASTAHTLNRLAGYLRPFFLVEAARGVSIDSSTVERDIALERDRDTSARFGSVGDRTWGFVKFAAREVEFLHERVA